MQVFSVPLSLTETISEVVRALSYTNLERNLRIVDEVEAVARDVGATAAQVALAWLLARGEDIVPIPGTRSPERLEQNVAAADVVLTGDELGRIQEILPRGAAGARYPAAMMPEW